MSFTFGGINCETMGMIVEKYPDRVFPERKQTVYSVPGRSGDLIVDENAYTNVIQSYQVYVREGGGLTMQQRLSAIGAWLLGTAGYQELRDSYDTSIYRKARVANAMEFLNSLNRFGRAKIEFDCQPMRFPTTNEILTGKMGDTFTYPTNGLLPALPKIEISNFPGGTVLFNLRIDVKNANAVTQMYFAMRASEFYPVSKVIIDFETQSIYNAATKENPAGFYAAADYMRNMWKPCGDGYQFATSIASGYPDMPVKITTRRASGI